jgi:hypothetical protein
VDVDVAYFSVQRQESELASHLSAVLHRGASPAPSGLDGTDGPLPNVVTLREGGTERVGLFWYEIDGEIVTSPYEAKMRTLWNTAVKRRSNGVIVVLLSRLENPARRAEQLAATMDLAARVRAELRPLVSGSS